MKSAIALLIGLVFLFISTPVYAESADPSPTVHTSDSGFSPPPAKSPPADVYSCSMFATQADAQKVYDLYYSEYGDFAHLDPDKDGIACERHESTFSPRPVEPTKIIVIPQRTISPSPTVTKATSSPSTKYSTKNGNCATTATVITLLALLVTIVLGFLRFSVKNRS